MSGNQKRHHMICERPIMSRYCQHVRCVSCHMHAEWQTVVLLASRFTSADRHELHLFEHDSPGADRKKVGYFHFRLAVRIPQCAQSTKAFDRHSPWHGPGKTEHASMSYHALKHASVQSFTSSMHQHACPDIGGLLRRTSIKVFVALALVLQRPPDIIGSCLASLYIQQKIATAGDPIRVKSREFRLWSPLLHGALKTYDLHDSFVRRWIACRRVAHVLGSVMSPATM